MITSTENLNNYTAETFSQRCEQAIIALKMMLEGRLTTLEIPGMQSMNFDMCVLEAVIEVTGYDPVIVKLLNEKFRHTAGRVMLEAWQKEIKDYDSVVKSAKLAQCSKQAEFWF